jgi:hypothetical protein
MQDGAIFVGFGRAARARERQANEWFDNARQFYADLEEQGAIDSVEVVLLQPHGGDLTGFFLIRGSRDQLDRLRDHETFRRLNARAPLVYDNVGVVPAYVGEGLAGQYELYRSQVEEQLTSP